MESIILKERERERPSETKREKRVELRKREIEQEIDRETNLGMNHGDVFQHIKNNQRQLFQCIIKSYCHVSEM